MSHPNLLDRSDAVLVIVDLQDVLLRVIHEAERVVENTVRLVEAAKLFSIPVIVTVQNAERMGGVTQAVADALPHDNCLNKMSFSCLGGPCFPETLEQTGRKQILLCGVESHVCVCQTAHDLLARGYAVHVASDAVSSRTPENRHVAIEKMRDSGCVISSTEMAIFEFTRDASTPEFKHVLKLVK